MTPREKLLQEIKRSGVTAYGKLEAMKILSGKLATYRERCLAQCYTCMGFYRDGKADCGCSDCVLYDIMPYRKTEEAV